MKMKGGLKAVREKSSLCRECGEVERESAVVFIPSYSYTYDYRCTWKESKREQKLSGEKKNINASKKNGVQKRLNPLHSAVLLHSTHHNESWGFHDLSKAGLFQSSLEALPSGSFQEQPAVIYSEAVDLKGAPASYWSGTGHE